MNSGRKTGWLRPPRELLARVRWFFLLTAFFNAALSLLLIVASGQQLPIQAVGVAATLFMSWRWKRGYERGAFEVKGDFAAGVALVLVGFGAGDPMRCAMLVYIGLFLQALFGTRRRLVIAVATHVSAYGVALLFSPTTPTLTIWSPEVLLQPPGVAMVAVMYVLGNTLARHERAAGREHALARVGSELVASRDREDVFAAALKGVRAIVSPHGAAQAIMALGDADRMQVIGATSANADILLGQTIDYTRLPRVRDQFLAGRPFELDEESLDAGKAQLRLPSRPPTVFVSPLLSGERLSGALAIVTESSLPDECKDGLQALTTEVALALDNLVLREQLAHQAFHDPLTNLANRALLEDRMRHALGRDARQHRSVALLLLDVDGFKTVNDSLGHVAGDQVLSEVAARLRACLREVDTGARLGGDEFAVLLEDLEVNAIGTAKAIARRIQESLNAPIMLETTEVFVSASIGIAVGSGTAAVEELLSQADTAMYAAKRSGKARFAVFEPRLRADVVRRLELETDLRHALEAGHLSLQYQPIVQLSDGAPVGFEALVRWNRPRRGLIGPEQFIVLAEETGLIVPLGRWVLLEACREAARWQRDGDDRQALSINVNVAARQLREPTFVEDVKVALADSGLAADLLVLEVTETALLHRSEGIVSRLEDLRALGVRLALDDFGTGYSSLAYLRDLPFDSVKIDRSFVEDIDRDAAHAALVQAIVSLSSALKLKTVAEGVESAVQAERLAQLGCDMGQGFYFARPAEPAEVITFLVDGLPGLRAA